MLRTFSVVIFISTIVVVVLKLFTYMLFTYMHFVIFIMFNVLYRRRLSCHLGEINAGFELFGHGHGCLATLILRSSHTLMQLQLDSGYAGLIETKWRSSVL